MRDDIFQRAWEQRVMSIEDKLIRAYRKPGLSDQEITEEVEGALAEFPPGAIDENYIDVAFDIIYDAIEKAIGRIK